MKNRILLLVAGFGLLVSCNSDDSSSDAVNPVGTYRLTAFNISEAQDLNGDGTASVNQMNETACLNDSFLTLNANNTFVFDDKGIEIGFDGENETVDCYDDGDVEGTWSVSGNAISFTYTFDGDVITDTFTLSGSTLTMTVQDGEVVGMSGGNPVYVTADISAVYTKQ